MKIREILAEYDRSKTAQRLGGSVAAADEQENQLSNFEPEPHRDEAEATIKKFLPMWKEYVDFVRQRGFNENQINMESFKSYIDEARKNPDLNPKISVNEYISNHYADAGMLSGTDAKNSFVSFTSVDKLGINPGSGYNTPLGIYSYPSSYIMEKIGSDKIMRSLPFAGDNPYANIFSAKGNIIDLSTMSDRELGNYNRKMIDVFIKTARIKPGSGEWKATVDFLEKDIFARAPSETMISSPGGKFWFITMKFAYLLMTAEQTRRQWRSGQHHVSWNKLFREIGIDGCIDSSGDGIIHTSEPFQAVFFSIKSIDKNQRVDNRYSPDTLKTRIDLGKSNRETIKMLSSMSEDEQIEAVKNDYTLISYIKNPSEKVQFAAAKESPFGIFYIKNPSEKVQIAAVKESPFALKHIKNPSEKVQLAAVENDTFALQYIKNPSEKVQLAAVENDTFALQYIKNPTEKVKKAAQKQAAQKWSI